ncbi:MAG TPA: methyltransferase domain-containing protein [Dehalococcoidia bacterium]|nr:methyltransferase domain-containing protein [Dehalococcoidia bacterium]
MATNSSISLDIQRQKYFDRLASSWDKEVTQETLECLGNIIKELNISPGSRVLDIGSGTGIFLPFLIEAIGGKGRIIALDFSAEMLHQAKAKTFNPIVDFIQSDVTAIPLPDNYANLAICNSAFPHFGNKSAALKEIARVIKSNGQLVICHTASRDKINQLHQAVGGVVSTDLLPDESRLRELIEQAGLAVTRLKDKSEYYLVIARKMTQTP